MNTYEMSLLGLKKIYERCKEYADYVQRGDWMADRNDVSDFWSEFLKNRQNYPDFNQIICLRRGLTYPLADRGGSDVNFEKEQLHAQTAFWNISQTVVPEYWARVQESPIGAPRLGFSKPIF